MSGNVVRWIFEDVQTHEQWVLPINPNVMDSPHQDRVMKFAQSASSPTPARTVVEKDRPRDWTFGGVIRTEAHHDALEQWAKKPGLVDITDHFGRTFRCCITAFNPEDRQPNKLVRWRLKYTMKTIILKEMP